MEAEIKTCELCGRLYVRASHPQRWCEELGRHLEVPNTPICLECQVNPPKEVEVIEIRSSYRVLADVKL